MSQAILQELNVASIFINANRHRPLNIQDVAGLAKSIEEIGLQVPITVRPVSDRYQLVVGHHRLKAMETLGRQTIPAIVRELDDIDAELWELSENLHRSDLTVLQRADHLTRWIQLTEEKLISAQVAQKLKTDNNPKGAGRPEGGISAASRELEVDRDAANRAIKIAKLSDEAREVAQELELDDNQTALLKAADFDDVQKQISALKAHKRLIDSKKKKGQLIQQSFSNEHYTPEKYIEAARAVLGTIDLDPASCKKANKIVKAIKFFNKKDDGLSQDWSGKVWLNPPYGGLSAKFIVKLADEYQCGNVKEAITLVNAHCTDTKWFQRLWDGAVCFTDHRINFYGNDERSGSTHGSAFGYFGPNPERFAEVFKQFGAVVRRI